MSTPRRMATSALAAVVALSAGATTSPAGVASRAEPAGQIVSTWSREHGPEGGWLSALLADPKHPRVVYALSRANGVFKSSDAGASWHRAGFAQGSVAALALAPARPRTLYAVIQRSVGGWIAGGTAYRSSDGGRSWRHLRGFPRVGATALAVDPVRPDTVYAATSGSTFKTLDGGRRWRRTDLPGAGWINAIAIDPSRAQDVYLGTSRGVLKSSDGGRAWRPMKNGFGRRSITALAIDPARPGVVYAAGYQAGVFKTTDGGRSWRAASIGLGSPFVQALAFDPHGGDVVYAASTWDGATSSGGVFVSRDGGKRWQRTGLTESVGALAVGTGTAALYAGTYTGVRKSNDGGRTWVSSTSGIVATWIVALAVDPRDARTVFAGTLGGLHKTTTGGTTWRTVGGWTGETPAVAIDPVNSRAVYASHGAVQRSGDGGETWEIPYGPHALALAVSPRDPRIVHAGSSGGVHLSTDGGSSWQLVGLPGRYVSSLAIDDGGTILYAGVRTVWEQGESPRPGGVHRSTNGGSTWVEVSSNLPPDDRDILSLAVDPRDPARLFAGGWRGVWRSTDGGARWTYARLSKLASGAAWAIALDPLDLRTVYAGTGSGVYRSTDGGVSWQPFGGSLGRLTVSRLAVSADGRIVYAGTMGGGVFDLVLVR